MQIHRNEHEHTEIGGGMYRTGLLNMTNNKTRVFERERERERFVLKF